MWIFKYLSLNTESATTSSFLCKNTLEIINTMILIMTMSQLNADAILAECEGFRNQKST